MAPQYISDGFRAGNFITGTGNYAENDGKNTLWRRWRKLQYVIK